MVNFPFFRLPFNNYYKYYNPYIARNNSYNNNCSNNNIINNNASTLDNNDYKCKGTTNNLKNDETVDLGSNFRGKFEKHEKSSRYKSFGPISFKNPFLDSGFDLEEPVLQVLGLNLYLDDIIIIGLLFFLYEEGVKDDMLFLSLILLLLS